MTAAWGEGKKKKKKGSLVTPLRPGDLVPTAYSLWEGRAVKTKPVTGVKKTSPDGSAVSLSPGTLRALGHIQP